MQERRSTQRYSISAKAHLKGPTGDEFAPLMVLGLGMRGCRVSIEKPLTVGQEFELTIMGDGYNIVAKVVVVYWHRTGFAGLHFISMSQLSELRIKKLVEYIAENFGTAEPGRPPTPK